MFVGGPPPLINSTEERKLVGTFRQFSNYKHFRTAKLLFPLLSLWWWDAHAPSQPTETFPSEVCKHFCFYQKAVSRSLPNHPSVPFGNSAFQCVRHSGTQRPSIKMQISYRRSQLRLERAGTDVDRDTWEHSLPLALRNILLAMNFRPGYLVCHVLCLCQMGLTVCS